MKLEERPDVYIQYEFITSSEIVVCSKCRGTGVVKNTIMTSYHNGDYETTKEVCDRCEGNGRYIEEKTLQRSEVKYENDFAKCRTAIKKITPDTDLLDRPSSYVKYNQKLTQEGKPTKC